MLLNRKTGEGMNNGIKGKTRSLVVRVLFLFIEKKGERIK